MQINSGESRLINAHAHILMQVNYDNANECILMHMKKNEWRWMKLNADDLRIL